MRNKEQEKPEFDMTDRGYNVKGWYLKDTKENKGDALIQITKDGKMLREFIFPAYKIWNIAAHFGDIVDSEITKDDNGYRIASSTGFGGSVGFRKP